MTSVCPSSEPDQPTYRAAIRPIIFSMKFRFVLPIILFMGTLAALAVPTAAVAQTDVVQLSLVADAGELTVGDPVTIRATAVYPAGYQVLFPDLPNQWGSFEVRQQVRTAARTNADGTETATQVIEVALFGTGAFETPDYSVTLRNELGQTQTVQAPPITLTVTPVLPAGSLQLKDIKPQTDLPWIVAWPVLPAGALLIAVLGMAVFLVIKWVKSLRLRAAVRVDTRSPYEVAQDELADIRRLDLPGQGQIKEHYTTVSDSVRRYLERAYEVAATDLTTEEVRRMLRSSAITTEDSRDVIALLADCDLVKFTALEPDADTAREMTERARELVEMMTPWGSWSGRGGSR